MSVTISTPVPVKRDLEMTDPSGETFVLIMPPDFAADRERAEMLKNRSFVPEGNYFRTQVEYNLNDLWAVEIWLTYVETNLHVVFRDKDGNVTKEIKFEPRAQMSRSEFMSRLGQLPPGIVYEWHMIVVDIVRDWSLPF